MNTREIIKNGLWDQNIVFSQLLGMCPAMAVTTSGTNGLGMGLATTAVLVGSNILISSIRDFVSPQVRIPVYIVPRGDGHFMIGATSIENDERGRVTGRSMLELLSATYALHPAFGEAEIVEIGADVRPAYPDNIPRLRRRGNSIALEPANRAHEIRIFGPDRVRVQGKLIGLIRSY